MTLTHPASRPEDFRPLMRGSLHLAAAIAAPFGLVVLLLLANSPSGYVGSAIFASSLIALYTTSASYHMLPWPRRAQGVIKRLDHSMIFVLIAGTYTPFCLLAVDRAWGIPILSVVWSLAGAGVVLKMLWPSAPRWLSVALYMGVGWLGIVAAAEVIDSLQAPALATLILGGVMYTVGGFIYATKRPDPFPKVFGFHEVFHVFVLGGSLAHFGLVAYFLV